VSRSKGVTYIYTGGGGVGLGIGPVYINELHQHRQHDSRRTGMICDMDGQVLDIPGVDIGGIRFDSWHRKM
jgi:hypothetical protein